MPIVRDKKIEVLFSAEDIAKRTEELAEEIALSDLRDILVISVLKGSFVFAADLIRAFHKAGLAPEVEFISISSYGAGTEGGEIQLLQDIKTEPMTPEQVDAMKELAGSYEALFSRRSMKYRAWDLHEKELSEEDYRKYILEEYTFLKRPVLVLDDQIFVGNTKKVVQAAIEALSV